MKNVSHVFKGGCMTKAESKCIRRTVRVTYYMFKRAMEDYMATHSKVYPETTYKAFGTKATGYRLYEF